MIDNPHNSSSRAVIGKSQPTGGADMAGAIDFPDDSSASIPAGLRNTHKFVAQRTLKTQIALTQLHVGFADPGLQNIDSNLARLDFPELGIASKMQMSVKNDSAHGSILIKCEKTGDVCSEETQSVSDRRRIVPCLRPIRRWVS